MNEFQKKLKLALSIEDTKQVELSKKTGIPTSAINSYLSGKYKPKYENIQKIAKALDVGTEWLSGNLATPVDHIPRYKEEKLLLGVAWHVKGAETLQKFLNSSSEEATKFKNSLNELANQIDTSSILFKLDSIKARIEIAHKYYGNDKNLKQALEEIKELREQITEDEAE